MTREEAINCLEVELRIWERDCKSKHDTKDALKMAIKALSQEPETVTEFADRCKECGAKYGKLLKQYKAFAEWVAREVFSDDWEYNKDAFVEIVCRKLEKLSIVRVKGDEWELVELQAEKEDKE